MDKKIVVKRIEELMVEKKISSYQLKENADISSTFYQWKKNIARDSDRSPSLRSIEKICNFLGVSLSYFFAFEKTEISTVKQRELVKILETLNDEEIDVLQEMISIFKRDVIND